MLEFACQGCRRRRYSAAPALRVATCVICGQPLRRLGVAMLRPPQATGATVTELPMRRPDGRADDDPPAA